MPAWALPPSAQSCLLHSTMWGQGGGTWVRPCYPSLGTRRGEALAPRLLRAYADKDSSILFLPK